MTPGDRIGPYLIEAPIGEGGMGDVYRARDTRLDRTVAIKVSKAEFGERFAREAKAVAALNHPNICTLHDVGPNYLVMEYIDGTPLKGPLPLDKAAEYAAQILDALAAAHAKGFAHHDLKPANVMVTKQGIKLLDFGLAQRSSAPISEDEPTRTSVPGEGEIAGTLQYMAPEQLQGKTGDGRSDLFAFGCVLYELISGRRAFDGESRADVISAIMTRDPAPLDVPPPLGRVIKTCMEKDPDRRFQTALDLKRALSWAMEQQQTSATKPNRWLWAVAAAALAIGAIAGALVMSRPRPAPADEQAVRLQLTPPEGGRFDEDSLAVSQDGRMLAYAATVQGKRALWIRPLDGAAAMELPGTGGAYYPFWSPDARSLAYLAENKLWRIDLAGGSPRRICDARAVTGGAWRSDGTIIFTGTGGALFRVSAASGSPTPLTTLNVSRGERYHHWPHLLPGGRAMLFFVLANKPEDTGVYAVKIDNPGEHVRVVATASTALFASGHLLWRRGSTLVAQRFDPERFQLSGDPMHVIDPVGDGGLRRMALAASAGGVLLVGASGSRQQLVWFDRAGKSAATLGNTGSYLAFALSPDGRRVAVSKIGDSGADLWTVDLEREVWSRLTFAEQSNYPVWSPDGRTILFRSGQSLYRKDSSGAGAEEPVTEPGPTRYPTSWSRDGRSLLYNEITAVTGRDLWVLPVTQDGKPRADDKPRSYLRTPFQERTGRFSPEPNPRWVAYESDETGRYEVYVQGYPEPKGKWLVSNSGGQHSAWGPDGRELFYVSADSKLMMVKLKIGADAVEPSAPVALFDVAADGNTSLFSPFAVAPDGKRFLVRVPADTGPKPLEVILNWPALLKKSAAE